MKVARLFIVIVVYKWNHEYKCNNRYIQFLESDEQDYLSKIRSLNIEKWSG